MLFMSSTSESNSQHSCTKLCGKTAKGAMHCEAGREILAGDKAGIPQAYIVPTIFFLSYRTFTAVS